MGKKQMRHEIKICISYGSYIMLRSRFSAILKRDQFALDSGDYFVRSLYLDDINNSSFFDKISGVRDRKKYRIRIYNCNSDKVKLECKEKIANRIHKVSVNLSAEECQSIIAGDFSVLEKREEPLCQEVFTLAKSKGLKNSVVVDYDREAYIYDVSNVRITFDKHLHAGGFDGMDIFDENLFTMGIYPNDEVVLEVKYDKVIPQFITSMLPINVGNPIAISKFCLCRDKLMEFKFAD